MAQSKNTTNFEGLLFQFMDSPDPMLSMLEWLCPQCTTKTDGGKTSSARKLTRTAPVYFDVPDGPVVPLYPTD